jgi:hypothetical protein
VDLHATCSTTVRSFRINPEVEVSVRVIRHLHNPALATLELHTARTRCALPLTVARLRDLDEALGAAHDLMRPDVAGRAS